MNIESHEDAQARVRNVRYDRRDVYHPFQSAPIARFHWPSEKRDQGRGSVFYILTAMALGVVLGAMYAYAL